MFRGVKMASCECMLKGLNYVFAVSFCPHVCVNKMEVHITRTEDVTFMSSSYLTWNTILC